MRDSRILLLIVIMVLGDLATAVYYCPPLPYFNNGSKLCSGYRENVYGSICNFSCNDGYTLDGPGSILCGSFYSKTTWSNTFPSCRRPHDGQEEPTPCLKECIRIIKKPDTFSDFPGPKYCKGLKDIVACWKVNCITEAEKDAINQVEEIYRNEFKKSYHYYKCDL